MTPDKMDDLINVLTEKMKDAASRLEFEEAVVFRDRIKALKEQKLGVL